MLFPKKVKHRKWQRNRQNVNKIGNASRGTTVDYGSYGIKAVAYGRIKANQIEASRRALKRSSGKFAKVWIRIFPDRPYTRKAAEVGMGKGKGDPQGFEVEVLPGRMLFEVDGVEEKVAREALRKAGTKLPVKTKIVKRA